MSQVAQKAVAYAMSKVGGKYSRTYRWRNDPYTRDCSSFVYSAYEAAGVLLKDSKGNKLTTSTYQVNAVGFDLIYPSAYSKVGRNLPSPKDLLKQIKLEVGDIVFFCNNSSTTRANKITHVALYAGSNRYVHARNEKDGIMTNTVSYGEGKICGIIRFNDAGSGATPPDTDNDPTYPNGLPKDTLLKEGSKSTALVKILQQLFVTYSIYSGPANGTFDASFKKVVLFIQKDLKVKEDGIWGNITSTSFVQKYIVEKKPAPKYAAAPTQPDTKTNAVVTASSLNVRPTPSTSKAPVGKLASGTKLLVRKVVGSWAEIEYKQKVAYVHAAYLRLTMICATEKEPLNVRGGAGTQFKILDKISPGKTVTVILIAANGWSKVIYNGKTGYVSSKYLKL